MKSINGFIRKEWKRRQCTNLPHFWSNLQSAGYRPQRRLSTRSRMATWRLWYIKVRRQKALETRVCNLKSDWTSPGLQPDPKENVAVSLGWLEISQSISFNSLLHYLAVSFDTTVPLPVISDTAGFPPGKCWLGSWGRGRWGGKALVVCAVHGEEILVVFASCGGRWERGAVHWGDG